MKKVLVTGGYGFIGSNFIRHMLNSHDDCIVVNLDKLTYAGNEDNLKTEIPADRHIPVIGDICDRSLVERVFEEHNIMSVVHFAAESHVDRSIEGPDAFVKTNVVGTQILLDVARETWGDKPDNSRFVHISTDEVYGALGESGYFSETTPVSPNSPYSASKASSDLIARAYYKTYDFPVLITRCSNNYGPYQFPEKFIPLMIVNAMNRKPLPIYGDGLYVRDWLHVEDHCRAIDAVLEKGRIGEVYNIGGNSEKKNIDIAKKILSSLNRPQELIRHVKDRLGHDRRYAIDAEKIRSELGWSPLISFEHGIEKTVQWYVENEWWWKKLLIN